MKLRGSRSLALGIAVAGFALSSSCPALAEEEPGKDPAAEVAAGEPAADGDHGAGHHGFNFYYGLFGESDDVTEPTLLFRPKGMPVPFLALLVNAAILFGGLFWIGRKGLKQGLIDRRQRIIQGMEDAAKMKKQAREQLAQYEKKLADIEAEVERLRREMRQAAEVERANILAEAKARRERMERDARQLIEQELHAAREELRKDTIRGAVESATELLRERITPEDRSRLDREYLGTVGQGLRLPGGSSRGQA